MTIFQVLCFSLRKAIAYKDTFTSTAVKLYLCVADYCEWEGADLCDLCFVLLFFRVFVLFMCGCLLYIEKI